MIAHGRLFTNSTLLEEASVKFDVKPSVPEVSEVWQFELGSEAFFDS